jgi:hypothetical protein
MYLEAQPGSEAAQQERTEVRLWINDADGGDTRVHHDTVFHGKDN